MHDLSSVTLITHKGRLLVHMPEHPQAWQVGLIYYHRLVMENHLGRYLKPEEVVHHINGNPLDNDISNLEVLSSNAAHTHKHHVIDGNILPMYKCPRCGVMFKPDKSKRKYCSVKCSSKADRITERPSREELYSMVWSKPSSAIAQDLGVSGKTIEKWCKGYGINKPGRGYWSKLRSEQGTFPAHKLSKIHKQAISDSLKGRKSCNRSLADQEVMEIFTSSLSQRKLAEKYNVCKTGIQNIKAGKTYREITDKLR